MPFSYVRFMTELMAPELYPPQPNFAPPKLAPLRNPISRSTIGIFTSAGVQRRDQPLLGETNDLSYRLIDRETPYSDLVVAHQTPVRRWALEDLNVAFPRDRLIDLEAVGEIGRLAPRAVSMVGSVSRYTELIGSTVPRIKAEFDAQGVDLVLLAPF
jgi:D-proline reductase (dithiol) PrdB